MGRNFVCVFAAMTLALGTAATAFYPLTAGAQQPESEQMFKRRMDSRINMIQTRVKRLQRELHGDAENDDQRRGGAYDTVSGLGVQLEAVDEQCRELERELLRTNFGTAYDIYQSQLKIEYRVRRLEDQVRQIRRWMQPADDETESPVEPPPAPDTEEDGISDEDWAAEWAKGGP